jgi:hypothetical protein
MKGCEGNGVTISSMRRYGTAMTTVLANPDSPEERSIRDIEEEMESNEDAA